MAAKIVNFVLSYSQTFLHNDTRHNTITISLHGMEI